jgi:hypothetical protein
MKLQVLDLLESVSALQFLNDVALPMRLSFRLAQVTRQVDTHLESYNASRLKRINAYSEALKTAGGKPTEETEALRAEVEKEIGELQKEEILLPDISLTDVELEGQNIPAKHLVPLHWLIVAAPSVPNPNTAPAAT